MEYHAPDKKSFVVTSEKGSGLVRHLALNPLIASEVEAASGKQHHDSSITPANYSLHLLGEQQVGPLPWANNAGLDVVICVVPPRTELNIWI